jgi:hypothetical protein
MREVNGAAGISERDFDPESFGSSESVVLSPHAASDLRLTAGTGDELDSLVPVAKPRTP